MNVTYDDDMYVIWTMIRFIAHLMGRVRDKDLTPYGITVKQAAMLNIIHLLGEDATPVSIAKYLIREPSAVSNILIRMERLGWVKREKVRNQIKISLTEAGEEILSLVSKRESIKRVMEQLTGEERSQLHATAEKLRGILLEELGLSRNRPGPVQ